MGKGREGPTVRCPCRVTPRDAWDEVLVFERGDVAGRGVREVGEVGRLGVDAEVAEVELVGSEGADSLSIECWTTFAFVAKRDRIVSIVCVAESAQVFFDPEFVQSTLLPC